MTKGAEKATSTIVGLPPAHVEMREIDRGAVYDIIYPEGGGALSWLRKAVMWPFAARTVARELKEANETLHERYAQLEEAKEQIQRQATQLQTAFSIREVIRSNLDLNATIAAVAQSLVDVAHFEGAKVAVSAEAGGDSGMPMAISGKTSPTDRTLSKVLEARGQTVGELTVWLPIDARVQEAAEFLDQITPSITMEISDALSFTLLGEYRNREMRIQQEFSRQQIESQEAERKRLAAELHDGLGQNLLVISNEVQQFLQQGEPHEKLHQVASLLQESIEEVREIGSNLHPHHLDRLGFCAAVDAMTESLAKTTQTSIHTSCDRIDGLLPKVTELHVYRIIQEALSNVVRHASAKNAWVRVKRDPDSIEVTVSDDGRGFERTATGKATARRSSVDRLHGFGLSTMSERARIIGGTITIESAPGSGTTVQVSLPDS